MEKTYQFEVSITADCLITAKNEKEAKKILKQNWIDDNNIALTDKEISLIAVEKEKDNPDGTKDITIE